MKLPILFGALFLSASPVFANTWDAGFFRWPKSKIAVSYKVMDNNIKSFVIGFIMPISPRWEGMLIPSLGEITCRNGENWKTLYALNIASNLKEIDEVKIVNNIANGFCKTHKEYYSTSPYYN